MIVSFKSKSAEDVYNGIDSRESRKIPQTIWKVVQRKLDMLEVAFQLTDLRVPPANHLEALRGDLKGHYSIRVNDQYRVVFLFKDGNAYYVDVIDYH